LLESRTDVLRGLREKEEKWRKWTNSGYNTYILGNATGNSLYSILDKQKCHFFPVFPKI
jgi:hypothetical protein